MPSDYEDFAPTWNRVKGKIVLARYGGSWRGIKPKVAAEHGAIGCIIYSDPRDDGYYQGDVYPKGAWRTKPASSAVLWPTCPLYPGDPLTPGSAPPGRQATRYKDAPTMTKIPVMPISYCGCASIDARLRRPSRSEAWRGRSLTYHLGPGSATVHLKLEFDWDTVPLRRHRENARRGAARRMDHPRQPS